MKISQKITPSNGINGLKEFWKSDIVSGFLVFLLALPLSLGIAKASGFPPAMGVLSAMIGGIFTSFFKVSALSVKGPAAGLITICAAAVAEMGGDNLELGWHLVCAAIIVMAVFQILLGFLKFGSLSDFFPGSSVHGMLAAIGLIIIAKQFPVLMGVDPSTYKGVGPINLLADIPRFIENANGQIAMIGITALLIMFATPKINLDFVKKIPSPMIVLLFAIPLSIYFNLKESGPDYSLVKIGNFWSSVKYNADFSMIGTFTFWKFVFMFLFVSSLESLLTVKAVDDLDPYKRESDYNGDLKAQGAGNLLSGLLGGLPMISEVVRSSSNIEYGAKTKLSNFFHGTFLLIAMLLLTPIIELIPNAALAAMLIFAGYRLAAPKEFINIYKIGAEQLAIFLVTICVTLLKDLLLGIAAGIVLKFIFHLINGASLTSLFKANYSITEVGNKTTFKVFDVATFSNLIGFKKALKKVSTENEVIIDFSAAKLVDHSFMHFIFHFEKEMNLNGGHFKILGLTEHKGLSSHPLSTRILKVKK